MKLNQKRLKEVVKYDPDSGIFTNIIARGSRTKKGGSPGCKNNLGYISMCIDYSQYYSHILAWLYIYGSFPENNLDHINRDRSDNRIENLREVSKQCNARNVGNIITNTSGVKGVVLTKNPSPWNASITVNNKSIHLGSFKDFNEAVCHRLAAEQALGWAGCDSSSPAYVYVEQILKEIGIETGSER